MLQGASGKTLLLLTILLGIAAFLSLSPSTVSAPYAMTMAAQPMQSMQSAQAFHPMQPRRPRFQPVSANKMENEFEPSRREMMDGLAFAFAAALAHEKTALAVTPVDLKDDRKAKATGFDITYEARDLDLPQNVRDGMTQARTSVADTKKRVAESTKRFEAVLSDVKVAYWSDAGTALRRQVGTLRFDLNTLADAKPASEKKAALAAKKQFFSDVEKLDLAIKEKKMDVALKAYDKAAASLDAVLKLVA